ncbi:two-component sensor histidine kinase [Liquorilactobacillus nagelii]|uniref:histidine kinase n=1 Tax=Liquorilactobacillus nagelii TaxID=82688 RepID=A0A3S6QTR5_9LACO|nr:two-component sensor histidine kinase [Liquorilactobacillus nagelii]
MVIVLKVKLNKIIKNVVVDFAIIFTVLLITFGLFISLNNLPASELFGSKKWLLLVFSSLFFSLLDTSYRYWQQKKRQEKILLLSEKLRAIIAGEKPQHLLLAPSDPYFELAQSINQVQSLQRDIFKHYLTQQRGYFSLIEYLTIGVMVLDQDQKIYLSNHAMSDLMGREMNLKGHLYADELRNYDLSHLIETTFQTKKDQHTELKLEFNAKIVDAHSVFVPVSQHHFLVMVLLYDLTELKEIEQMQLDFVSNVSHELKTPITAITGFSETLLNGAMNDQVALPQFLKIIQQESLKLTALVEDILSLARISTNTTLKLKKIRLQTYLAEVLQSFQPEIKKKEIQVHNKVPADFIVDSDDHKLRHVINNLLQNAIKYNDVGGEVWISCQQTSQNWQLIVRDNGWGIPQDQQERVFERFFRIENSRSRQTGGTGLGLAVVKEYVAAMKGKIKVTSQVGVGSEFTIILPLVGFGKREDSREKV